MLLPPVLEIFVVWHPGDDAGATVAGWLLDHFHGTAFSGLIGGAVEVYTRRPRGTATTDHLGPCRSQTTNPPASSGRP